MSKHVFVAATVFGFISTPAVLGIPQVDAQLAMEERRPYQAAPPQTRPFWFEFTRTDIGTDRWLFRTSASDFGRPGYLSGTTIGFYDDTGALLYQHRGTSASTVGSRIGFGFAFNPNFGVGSTTMPDFNRPYYLGVGGVDTDFFPNFTFTRGTDQGWFVADIVPAPGPAATLAAAGLFAARRRRGVCNRHA